MYSAPGGGVQTLTAADPTVTVGGAGNAPTVKVSKQLDSSYLTDFVAAARAAAGPSALATDAGSLGADVAGIGNGAWVTVLTSAALGVGTWLVNFTACVQTASTAGQPTIQVAAGTATATLAGAAVAQNFGTATSNQPMHLSVTALVTVTAAGTLVFQAREGNVTTMTVRRTTGGGYLPATGYTAVKVA